MQSRQQWHNDRIGCFTASEIYRLLGKGRQTYINEKFEEWKTGEPKEFFTNEAMNFGTFYEPMAADMLRKIYPELEYFGVDNSRFFPYNDYSGVSPDGIIGSVLVEIKCPYNEEIHKQHRDWDAEALKAKKKQYYAQMQFNMLVLGLSSGLFVSFDPRDDDLSILKVPRDDSFIEDIKKALVESITILKNMIDEFISD